MNSPSPLSQQITAQNEMGKCENRSALNRKTIYGNHLPALSPLKQSCNVRTSLNNVITDRRVAAFASPFSRAKIPENINGTVSLEPQFVTERVLEYNIIRDPHFRPSPEHRINPSPPMFHLSELAEARVTQSVVVPTEARPIQVSLAPYNNCVDGVYSSDSSTRSGVQRPINGWQERHLGLSPRMDSFGGFNFWGVSAPQGESWVEDVLKGKEVRADIRVEGDLPKHSTYWGWSPSRDMIGTEQTTIFGNQHVANSPRFPFQGNTSYAYSPYCNTIPPGWTLENWQRFVFEATPIFLGLNARNPALTAQIEQYLVNAHLNPDSVFGAMRGFVANDPFFAFEVEKLISIWLTQSSVAQTPIERLSTVPLTSCYENAMGSAVLSAEKHESYPLSSEPNNDSAAKNVPIDGRLRNANQIPTSNAVINRLESSAQTHKSGGEFVLNSRISSVRSNKSGSAVKLSAAVRQNRGAAMIPSFKERLERVATSVERQAIPNSPAAPGVQPPKAGSRPPRRTSPISVRIAGASPGGVEGNGFRVGQSAQNGSVLPVSRENRPNVQANESGHKTRRIKLSDI